MRPRRQLAIEARGCHNQRMKWTDLRSAAYAQRVRLGEIMSYDFHLIPRTTTGDPQRYHPSHQVALNEYLDNYLYVN